MRFELVLLRGTLDQLCDFARAAILPLLQTEREQRTPIWSQVVTLAVEIVEEVRIAVATFGERVDHVSTRFIVDRIAVVILTGSEQRRKLLSSLRVPPSVNLITGAAGHCQTINHIRGHEWIALIIFPPTPTAIVVLVSVQAIETFLNFLVEIIRGANLRRRNVFEGLRNDDVRQEARHRLLGTSVRITCQVIERAEQRAGNRRRRFNAQISRLHVSTRGQIEIESLLRV